MSIKHYLKKIAYNETDSDEIFSKKIMFFTILSIKCFDYNEVYLWYHLSFQN